MKEKEPQIKILYPGSNCPPKQNEFEYPFGKSHKFLQLEGEKIFFCEGCGLCIQYGNKTKT